MFSLLSQFETVSVEKDSISLLFKCYVYLTNVAAAMLSLLNVRNKGGSWFFCTVKDMAGWLDKQYA